MKKRKKKKFSPKLYNLCVIITIGNSRTGDFRMTTAYLVEGHLGGLYVSTSDPSVITTYCDQCGDHDIVVASWQEHDIEAEAKAIAKYFLDSWNQAPETPWDAIRYWFEYMPDNIVENKNDALESIEGFDGYSCEEAKTKAVKFGKELWVADNIHFKEWGIEPLNEEKLIATLVATAKDYFGERTLGLDVEEILERDVNVRWEKRTGKRHWESDYPDGERILVFALDKIFNGYKELYEKHYDITL